MTHWVAERYLPHDGAAVDDDTRRIRAAAADLGAIRLMETVYLRGDDLCLYVFECETAEAVAELGRLAGIDVDRIRPAEVTQ